MRMQLCFTGFLRLRASTHNLVIMAYFGAHKGVNKPGVNPFKVKMVAQSILMKQT